MNIKKSNDLTKIVDDFLYKFENAETHMKDFQAQCETFKGNLCVLGTYSGVRAFDEPYLHLDTIKESLTVSAWKCVYSTLQIERLATAKDKQRFDQLFAHPPEFNKENVEGAFKDYLINPRQNILRGLAEVFCSLDNAYKSHSNIKIGVKGLPKRVIISSCGDYSSYGKNKINDILNALAAYQGLPLVEFYELNELLKNETALKDGFKYKPFGKDEEIKTPARGVWLKRFQNGNGHLFFSPECLKDINRALAEYYGEVLPDAYEHSEKPQNTEVAKDLQFYRTPKEAAKALLREVYVEDGDKLIEPSCGDAVLLDELKERYRDTKYHALGIEVNPQRAEQAKAKGHAVICANFLQIEPVADCDCIIMNPPFYGKHYEKHIRHAMKFLKDGGKLHAILPATARYDHKLLEDLKCQWIDLPCGSFSESGTNVNTVIVRIFK